MAAILNFKYAVSWCEVWNLEIFGNCSEHFIILGARLDIPRISIYFSTVSDPIMCRFQTSHQLTAYLNSKQNKSFRSFRCLMWGKISGRDRWDHFFVWSDPEAGVYWYSPMITCSYPFIHLGEERHCESKVSCPRTQHSDPDQGSNPDRSISSLDNPLTIRPSRLPTIVNSPWNTATMKIQ